VDGAAAGTGLRHKFLRHVQRTKVLAHCLSADSPDLKKDYEIVRSELKKFNEELLDKKAILVLTKTDLINKTEKKEKLATLKKLNKNTLAVSIHDLESLKDFQKLVLKISQ
ncbi:MAG: GTPase ObgE, partial [bacterium]|nr:GTPase ObgE [bacterium]